MPFIFPGSSEQLAPPPIVPLIEQPAAEVSDKLAALSADEPLPEVYAADLVRLLAQSPYRLYVYWNHPRAPYMTLRRAVGEQLASRYTLAIRLLDTVSGEESFFEASPSRNYWFNARPGHAYRADIGFYAQGRPFIRLLASEPVTTPRVSVSPNSDETPAFQVSAAEFAQVLNDAGYASDALEVTLEAADEMTGDAVTRDLAVRLAGTEAPVVADDSLREMRALLSALAFGVSVESLLPLLSPDLAAWLRAAGEEEAERLDSPRVLDMLRASLAIELEYDEELTPGTEEAMRRAARFVWGASDVRMEMPRRAPHLHAPSMNAGRISRLARWKKRSEVRG